MILADLPYDPVTRTTTVPWAWQRGVLPVGLPCLTLPYFFAQVDPFATDPIPIPIPIPIPLPLL